MVRLGDSVRFGLWDGRLRTDPESKETIFYLFQIFSNYRLHDPLGDFKFHLEYLHQHFSKEGIKKRY